MSAETLFDDSMPALERQESLDNAYNYNKLQGKPPYADVHIQNADVHIQNADVHIQNADVHIQNADVHIQTRGELKWIIQRRGWVGTKDFPDKEIEQIDFRHTILRDGNFSSSKDSLLRIRGACFTDAIMINIDLSGSEVTWADFSRANMEGACLRFSNFSASDFSDTNLEGADLFSAVLNGANFTRANLAGTNLQQVRMNQDTCLTNATTTLAKVGELRWNTVPMNLSGWIFEQGYDAFDSAFPRPKSARYKKIRNWQLGDDNEVSIQKVKKGKTRARFLREASRAYAGLATNLQNSP